MTKYKKLLWPALAVVGLSVLSAAFVGLSVLSAPAAAGGPDCPAFTTEMLDATALAFGLLDMGNTVNAVRDDPSLPSIFCFLERPSNNAFFIVNVNDGGMHKASTHGVNSQEGGDLNAQLFSLFEGVLTTGQEHACRAAVLKSFVWQRHCAPALP